MHARQPTSHKAMLVGNGLLAFLPLLEEGLDIVARICLDQAVGETAEDLSAAHAFEKPVLRQR